jgi:hypothetical protein
LGVSHVYISMTNISLAGKMPALRKSIHLYQWGAPSLIALLKFAPLFKLALSIVKWHTAKVITES